MALISAATRDATSKWARTSWRDASPTSKMTMTLSVSPYTTLLPGTSRSTAALVCWIMARPVAVTLAAMGTHGSMPLVAPRKPYTLFMVILYASCLPLCSAAPQSSPAALAAAMSRLAPLRNCARSSSSAGTTPPGACANRKVPMPVATS